MSGRKSVGTMTSDDTSSPTGYRASKGRGSKVSSRGLRKRRISVFSELARIGKERPTSGSAEILKPLPIGDWRVAAAERRVAIFNGNKGE